MLRELSDVYESARVNIPLKIFPERKSVPSWDDLDERVRTELEVLKDKVLSVLIADDLLLTNNHRVIGEFNRGVRKGYFSDPRESIPEISGNEMSLGPFQWGRAVGMRAKHGHESDPVLIKQFITATHLLAYEFGQLDQAFSSPFDFLVRNIGPERADEFGELVFALPILVNYRRPLIKNLIDTQDFSFGDYYATQSPTPTHLEYLTHGLIALFDPMPESWVRVGANFGLAIRPFADGVTLQAEHFQAPLAAATTVFNKPIAAHTVVRRQVERIAVARNWIGTEWTSIEMDDDADAAPVTLWDVYQSTAAASVRDFGDLVASNVVGLLSEYFEENIGPDDTRFGYMRRHLPAFTRGFDPDAEGAVDPRALTTAARGRTISEGLLRFESGEEFVDSVCSVLGDLGTSLNELHHALENPVGFVRTYLDELEETPLAARLLDLFRLHPNLPGDLFSENAEYEFFSRTQIQTSSPYDLIRSVLFHVVQAVRPTNEHADEIDALLATARRQLQRLLVSEPEAPKREPAAFSASRSQYQVVLTRDTGPAKPDGPSEVHLAAALFDEEFDTLVRLMSHMVLPLHFARLLGKPNSAFGPGYLDRLRRRGTAQLG